MGSDLHQVVELLRLEPICNWFKITLIAHERFLARHTALSATFGSCLLVHAIPGPANCGVQLVFEGAKDPHPEYRFSKVAGVASLAVGIET